MLRKFAYNRIFRTSGMLLLFLLLLLFPVSKEYSLDDENVSTASKTVALNEVYLIDKDGYVARTKAEIYGDTDEKYAENLIELLIIDGKYSSKIPNGFRALIPADTKINEITLDDDSITVDLSSDLLELNSDVLKKVISLITYNLTTIDNVKYVYLKVEGDLLSTYPNSNVSITQPLKKEDGVNIYYDAFNYKNTSKTTVYYVNKSNDGYYYVPITKISNDNREKIKIIIDELTSSFIYETNLMSFLNYNTKLISYELTDEVLTLNFNEFLFDDVSNKNILEEVIYSICLSVRDNYDVEEVIFIVDGNEITKSVLKDIE